MSHTLSEGDTELKLGVPSYLKWNIPFQPVQPVPLVKPSSVYPPGI